MAIQIEFFMVPEDEVALFRQLERYELDLWPELVPRGYTAPKVSAARAGGLGEPAYYFAVGDVQAHPVRRGPGRGMLKIDELISPVVHFERSLLDEYGELRSGHFWAETELAGDNSRLGDKPQAFRRFVGELEGYLKARYRRSQPTGFFVGPAAARLAQAGTLLRKAGRKGHLVVPFR